MTTLTPDQTQAIIERLARQERIPAGLGDEHAACSIAAINLALTGELTDDIPDCMSEVIGKWVISMQDSMPDSMRNSQEWRDLLPLAAGTGRLFEQQRLAIVLDHMWETLTALQPMADEKGFGQQWQVMCRERTVNAAGTAADVAAGTAADAAAGTAADAAAGTAADAARAAAYAAARAAAYDARAAAYAADAAADAAAYAAADAAARAAARAAAYAAYAAADAADAARAAAGNAAGNAAGADFWQSTINPCKTLHRLIEMQA